MSRIVDRSRELRQTRGPGSLGFYNSGQLFLEEYYTLCLLARVGIGTNHLDGNTRLCTATAEWALKQSFGSDGQVASYADVDECDVLVQVGHNVPETQTVLWMRMLDRLRGPDRPRLVDIDPRPTIDGREADCHLQIRPGTNVAVLNAIQCELMAGGCIDERFLREHTVGYDSLRDIVLRWPAERAAEICDVPAARIREAAQIIGGSERLLTSVLQGIYQSNQATAAAVQINNIHLLRGMIGRPGCGVLQMNGQPTAENSRECSCNGELPGFRNWQNEQHIAELAQLWNVDPLAIPHWASSTHVMQMLRFAEEGSLGFLWVIATNPAVSLTDLGRIRRILGQDRLFLVVQDAFLTETARLADVVLPAAIWGEKTGTFTNSDRTVHLSEQAVEPPGEARSDLEIFLDYAERMGFTDKDGAPLIKWREAETAFEAWKECSRGRLCDYTGMSYQRLRGGSGLQWPCNDERPDGTERLYEDLHFWTEADRANTFGADLVTGAPVTEPEYRAHDPGGRAILYGCDYLPPAELPSDELPFLLTTGRTVYHWHTRTKTARAPQLQQAAPSVWVELNLRDAQELGISEGDVVEIRSPRGSVRGPARLTEIRPGTVFIPFHYGYWDAAEGDRTTAANELTVSGWDPVSKQPLHKWAAVAVSKVAPSDGRPAPAPTTTASMPATDHVPPTTGNGEAEAIELVGVGDDGEAVSR
jgi:anaerobic selenocysteine-containing dehydrogenase